jgi:hypothetical protein
MPLGLEDLSNLPRAACKRPLAAALVLVCLCGCTALGQPEQGVYTGGDIGAHKEFRGSLQNDVSLK